MNATDPNISTAAEALPLRVIFAPGHPQLVRCPYKLSTTTFIGWGSIRGITRWPATYAELRDAMRNVISGCRNTMKLKDAFSLVIGAEFRTAMLAEDPSRWEEIDTMLRGVVAMMKMVHGPKFPVGISGPEEAIAGDFCPSMIGPGTGFSSLWNTRRCHPFLSTLYGADARQVVERSLIPIALGPGFFAPPVLWVQHKTIEGQLKEFAWGAEVQRTFKQYMDWIAELEQAALKSEDEQP